MKQTYRAMQVSRPGVLELVERPTPAPGTGEVLIEVEACGICGADIGDIEGADPALQPPRVPGHEVVGRIVARASTRRASGRSASGSASAAWAGIATNVRSAARAVSSCARTSRSSAPAAMAVMPR